MNKTTDFYSLAKEWVGDSKSAEFTGIDAVVAKLEELTADGENLIVDLFDSACYDRITGIIQRDGFVYILGADEDGCMEAVKIKNPRLEVMYNPNNEKVSCIVLYSEESKVPSSVNIRAESEGITLYDTDGAEIRKSDSNLHVSQIVDANIPTLIHAKGSVYAEQPLVKDRLMKILYENRP